MAQLPPPSSPSPSAGIIANWMARHRHPASLALHAIGIPMLVLGLILGGWQLALGLWGLWWRPVGLIAVSYLLQWIGHLIEGNDMGEVILIRKMLGKPYVAIAPDRQTEDRQTGANKSPSLETSAIPTRSK